MSERLTASALAARLSDTSAHSIASDLSVMITRGDIPVGTMLPPVRELAQALWVSPSTVSAAWRTLKNRGVLEGQGRAGVRVVRAPDTPRPLRYEANRLSKMDIRLDLGASTPDPALLPRLTTALAHVPEERLNSYARDRITPSLEAAATRDWPYEPRSMMSVSGGYDGLRLTLQTFVNAGDWVLVENPTPARILDLVNATGARLQFLPRDAEGIVPAALQEALKLRPAAMILQPGVHNPLGTSMSAGRRDELAIVLTGACLLVIEDDGAGALFADDTHPLSPKVGCPHVYIRSFSKSHGPDLRLAVMEGDEETVAKVHAFFRYGAGWVSRPLQEALAWMLRDDESQERVRQAGDTYRLRREALAAALQAEGIRVAPGHGLDVMVPVRDEGYAQGVLAAHGILISRGADFTPHARHEPWIRVTTSLLPIDEAGDVARLIAQAAQ